MSKDTFHAAFDDVRVHEFKNTIEGIESFLKSAMTYGHTKHDTTVGVESTGVYHHLLCVYLHEHGWHIVVINPLLTAQMISAGLRMVKTDRKDAQVVRLATTLGKGYPFLDTKEVLALKALVSERADLIQMRADLKRRMHAHTVRARACGMVLHDSYAPAFAALTSAIRTIDTQLSTYARDTQALLRSISGIGRTTGALLVAFVGDVNRFHAPEQLVAYIGIDPRVKQSGTSIRGKGYITKRGNTLLRHMLYQSAFIAARHDPDLKRYYEKKRKEGMHHTAVLCAVERKLIHRIFAVWKRGTPYVKTPKT